jgi:hypothetical protein
VSIPAETTSGKNDPQSVLTPRHLAGLRDSGLSDQTIAEEGFHSEVEVSRIRKLLNWKKYGVDLGPCLVIPFRDLATGELNCFARLKPDRPRRSRDGKGVVKYEQPVGATNRIYVPKNTFAVLRDPTAMLMLTEGEKKSAKASQEGIPCVGLTGVWNWQRKRERDEAGRPRGERQLIPDLAGIPWQGRSVCIAFDSDASTNPNVLLAEQSLAEVLGRHGAVVKIVRLPPGDPGPDGKAAKVGLDDFLLRYGPDKLRELMTAAVAPQRWPAGLYGEFSGAFDIGRPCVNQRPCHFRRRDAASCSSVIDLRCNRWACSGCIDRLCWRYALRVSRRFDAIKEVLFVWRGVADRWPAIRVALHRAKARYVLVRHGGSSLSQITVVSTAPLPGASRVSPRRGLAHVVAAMRRIPTVSLGKRRRVRPVSASRGFVPPEKRGSNEWVFEDRLEDEYPVIRRRADEAKRLRRAVVTDRRPDRRGRYRERFDFVATGEDDERAETENIILYGFNLSTNREEV